MIEFVFLSHLISTAIMVGVIWIVQLVHYPSFRYIESGKFRDFAFFHRQKIAYIVAPVMVVELLTGLFLLPHFHSIFAVSMVMLLGVWLVTFFYSIKEHNILLSGKDEESIERLVKTNWYRTLLWSIRLVIISTLA